MFKYKRFSEIIVFLILWNPLLSSSSSGVGVDNENIRVGIRIARKVPLGGKTVGVSVNAVNDVNGGNDLFQPSIVRTGPGYPEQGIFSLNNSKSIVSSGSKLKDNNGQGVGKKERIFLGDDSLISFGYAGAATGGKISVGGGFYGGTPLGSYTGLEVGLPHHYRPFSFYGPPGPILSGGVYGSYGISGFGGSLGIPGGYHFKHHHHKHHFHHLHNFHGHGHQFSHFKYHQSSPSYFGPFY